VPRPLSSQNVTPAAIFRVVEAHQPTLLIDEADTFLYDNDDLRGILNGNRKGSRVLRTVGDDHEPRAFSVYAAAAIALIGQLPDTLHDRAVTIDLQRRRASETITSFRPDRADHLDVLARKMARWAKDHADRIAERDPEMRLINRRADNWRCLLAIADEVGGEWPERARKAAEASHNAEGDDASRLELLLGDIQDAFAKKGEAPVANMFAEKVDVEIASADLVKALVAIEGRPWAEMGKSGKPLTQAKFARMLKPLGISPGNIGEEKARVRGYKLTQFEEAFSRYLPPEGDSKCTGAQNAPNTGTSDISKPHSPGDGCADVKCEKPNNDGLLGACAVANRDGGKDSGRVADNTRRAPGAFTDANGKPTDDPEQGYYGRVARAQFEEAYQSAMASQRAAEKQPVSPQDDPAATAETAQTRPPNAGNGHDDMPDLPPFLDRRLQTREGLMAHVANVIEEQLCKLGEAKEAKQVAVANGGDAQVEKFQVSTADAARYGIVYRRIREQKGEAAAKNEMSWELSTVAMIPPGKLPRELERIQRLAGH
jgi:Protein of unknown function (DUF3631)